MSNSSNHSIDLSYRPRTYFWADDLHVGLSSSIKGTARKKLYERSVAAGEELDARLIKPVLTREERIAWGRLHPALMGGEYLPDRKAQEVEIARIAIASTTGDVTSVYAKRLKNRIQYRVVDEYGGDTLSDRSTRTSIRPLPLGELVDFFLGAWHLLICLDANFESDGYPPGAVHGFITDASSSFYPEFGTVISQRVDAWLETVSHDDRESA